MKKKVLLIGISLVFLICVSVCLSWSKAMLAPDEPTISIWGGIYDEEILVELSTTWGNEIYYTTDGSVPTYQSVKYEEPIRVVDRSQEENIYRNVKNVVPDWLNYEPETMPVEKGTVIRAISVSKWGNSSEIATETYFIGREDLKKEDGYIISLVADPEELFGKDGIYVTGQEYDNWYLLGKSQLGEGIMPNFYNGVEIGGSLEVFDKGEIILKQLVGIRVRGASTRIYPLKNFNLTARKEYSGSDIFDIELYENVKTHSVMFEPPGIYVAAADILSDRDISVQKSHKVKVFLNGEFWYDTYMMERYDQKYFEEYYGVKSTVLVKNKTGLKCKRYETQKEFEELVEWIEKADFTDDVQWEILKKKVDIQSYIDYMAANIYLCNVDLSAEKNQRRWFSEDKGVSPYEDGRTYWAIFDVDLTGTAERNSFSEEQEFELPPINENPFYRAFYVNEEYRKQFVLSFMDMANNNFSPQNLEPILYSYGMNLSWHDNFFLKRYDYIIAYLAEEFKLSGELVPVEIFINDTEAGNITVNTSTIKFSEGAWNGKYFTDYPITITATPNQGYRFVGWEDGRETADEMITVSLENGLKLRAIFEKV